MRVEVNNLNILLISKNKKYNCKKWSEGAATPFASVLLKNKITRDVTMIYVTQNNIYSKNYLNLFKIVPHRMGGSYWLALAIANAK